MATVLIHAIQTGTVELRKPSRNGQVRGPMRFLRIFLNGPWSEPLPIYAWVIEHPEGIIVIDTGETSRISQPGYLPWWNPRFRLTTKRVKAEEEIGPRLRALGIEPSNVRWVILTHLHADHAGGLHYFPEAEIIVSRREYELASGFMGSIRGYLPNRWPSWFRPRLVEHGGRSIGPFPWSLPFTEAGDVHLVPTEGHTGGHLSVILRTRHKSILFAGDASYTEREMLNLSGNGFHPDEKTARRTLERILLYTQEVPTIYLPTHDPGSAKRLDMYKAAHGTRVSEAWG